MPAILSRLTLVFMVSLLLIVPALRPAAADDLSDAYFLPELFEIMAEEGRRSALADGATPLQGQAFDEFERDIERIYRPEAMRLQFMHNLNAELESAPEVIADALDFASTDLGQRVLRLEISARAALLDDEVDDIARMALQEARSTRAEAAKAGRLAMVRERIEVNDLIDLNVSLGLNTSYAYYRGMMAENAVNDLSAEQLLYLVWAQEPAIRIEIEDWSESYFLLAYQPLSDTELREYIDYVASPLAQSFNRAMFRAFDATFNEISQTVGRALGRRLNAEEL